MSDRTLLRAGDKAIIADRQQALDSARWLCNDWQAIEQHRDGATLDAKGLPYFMLWQDRREVGSGFIRALTRQTPRGSPSGAAGHD